MTSGAAFPLATIMRFRHLRLLDSHSFRPKLSLNRVMWLEN